jgi:hypothetical protein
VFPSDWHADGNDLRHEPSNDEPSIPQRLADVPAAGPVYKEFTTVGIGDATMPLGFTDAVPAIVGSGTSTYTIPVSPTKVGTRAVDVTVAEMPATDDVIVA